MVAPRQAIRVSLLPFARRAGAAAGEFSLDCLLAQGQAEFPFI
jgi:hypothetical protein